MMNRNAWTPEEDAYLSAARAESPPVPYRVIGKHLGRSAESCNVRYNRRLRDWGDDPKIEAVVREHWGTKSASDIGQRIMLTAAEVRGIADRLNLGPTRFDRSLGVNPAVPPKPRRYTKAELAWAKANRRCMVNPFKAKDEAGLILLMAGEAA